MSPTAQLQAYAQSIYLVIKNRYFDEIEGEDGQAYINQVIDWTNMFADELRYAVDSNNQLVDWWFARQNSFPLGTATTGSASIPVPSGMERLLTDETRYVQISHDGTVVSSWKVVDPSNITNRTGVPVENMCAVVGTNIVFSRAFKDTENTGSIVGDVIVTIPTLTTNNVSLLNMVKPVTMLKLGVAKNATLPDIVQGGLNPAYVQKFNDLIEGAMARSRASSVAAYAQRDDLSGISGLY